MNYSYWFANITELGIRAKNQILSQVECAQELYFMTEKQLMQLPYMTPKWSEAIINSRKKDYEASFAKLSEQGIWFLSREDLKFPKKLKEIPDAPYSLYVKGKLPDPEKKTVAIVGARRCSAYGHSIAEKIGKRLAECGAQVISGMAQGIDGDGHRGAISGKGETFAVLGCGADVCYPKFHQTLYSAIIKQGGILSEYAPGTQPLSMFFPQRNRIISGLSDIVVVVEARARSGSLITADAALEQGKEIYAVPGRLYDDLSAGCNTLIHQGAGIISDVEEFIKELELCDFSGGNQQTLTKLLLAKEESMVYSCLSLRPKSIEELLSLTGMKPAELAMILSGLTEKGFAAETVRNYYMKRI